MADSKVSALTNKAILDGTELLMIVDDPAGTPTSKRTTAQAVAALLAGIGIPVYAIKVAQSGVNNPLKTDFYNNSGLSILDFSRSQAGVFDLQFSFDWVIDKDKTVILHSGHKAGTVRCNMSVDNLLTITTTDNSNVAADGILNSTYIVVLFFQ